MDQPVSSLCAGSAQSAGLTALVPPQMPSGSGTRTLGKTSTHQQITTGTSLSSKVRSIILCSAKTNVTCHVTPSVTDRLKRCRIELRTSSYAERSVPIDRPLASFQCWSDIILRQLGLRFGSYLAMSRSIPLERLSRMLFRVLYAFCSERLRFSSCRSRTGTEMNV
jgi:hypothetical protein